jgi:hypothetical protein
MPASSWGLRRRAEPSTMRRPRCFLIEPAVRAGLTTRATVVRASIVHAERDRLVAVLFLGQRCERASLTSPGPADFRASEQRSVWR